MLSCRRSTPCGGGSPRRSETPFPSASSRWASNGPGPWRAWPTRTPRHLGYPVLGRPRPRFSRDWTVRMTSDDQHSGVAACVRDSKPPCEHALGGAGARDPNGSSQLATLLYAGTGVWQLCWPVSNFVLSDQIRSPPLRATPPSRTSPGCVACRRPFLLRRRCDTPAIAAAPRAGWG